jgi:hypothetical protein
MSLRQYKNAFAVPGRNAPAPKPLQKLSPLAGIQGVVSPQKASTSSLHITHVQLNAGSSDTSRGSIRSPTCSSEGPQHDSRKNPHEPDSLLKVVRRAALMQKDVLTHRSKYTSHYAKLGQQR